MPSSHSPSVIDVSSSHSDHDLATDADTADSAATVAGDAAAPTHTGLVAGRHVSSLYTQRAVDDLCKNHGVPNEYTARPAGDRLACTPPPEGAVCVYAHVLEAGMRVPPPEFFSEVLTHFCLAPSQLSPNGWRVLVAFFVLCHDRGVLPSLAVFLRFFYLVEFKLRGLYFFRGKDAPRALFTRLPKCNKGWKHRFFLLTSPDPWPCPVRWGKPPSKSNHNGPVLTSQQEKSVAKLLGAHATAVDLRTYLCEKKLAAAFSSSHARESPRPPASVLSTSTGAKGMDKSARKAPASASQTEQVKTEIGSHTSALPGKKRNREEAISEDGDGPAHSELNSLPGDHSCSATAPSGFDPKPQRLPVPDAHSTGGETAGKVPSTYEYESMRQTVKRALELEKKLADQAAARAELKKKDAEVLALWGKVKQGESMHQTVNRALELKKKMAEQTAAKAELEKKDSEVRALRGN